MTRFIPGKSGNPDGRPKGSKNRSTLLLEALDDDLPELLSVVKAKAVEGDMTAMRLLLDRALPTRKPTSPPVNLPELSAAKTFTDKAGAILCAAGNGQLPPDVAAQLLSALGGVVKVLEIDDLLRRIEALEVQKEQTNDEH